MKNVTIKSAFFSLLHKAMTTPVAKAGRKVVQKKPASSISKRAR